VVAGVTFGEGELRLSPRTAAKYVLLKNNVHARTGKWIFITRPYGAGRTRAQQAYLRDGYDRRLPGFNYAAKPDTPQANHQDRGDGGHAFDINNWASVGEQVIIDEARKVGLVRDPSERWHWNDNGVALASLGITPIEKENDMADITRDQMQQIAIVLLDTGIETAVGPRTVKQALSDALLLGQAANTAIEKIPDGTARAVAAYPLDRPDLPQAKGKPQQTQLGTMISYLQTWVTQLDVLIRATGGAQLTDDQVKEIGKVLAKSIPTPQVDEASLVRKIIAGVRGIFTRAGTEG